MLGLNAPASCLKTASGKQLPTRVLLADDYDEVRLWLKTVLEAKGYQVDLEAASGEEAVALAVHHEPDLIVMDFHMPLLNGLDAARKILQALPAIHVIMLTSHVNQDHLAEGLQIGIRGFAVKTGKAEDVLKAIREVLTGNIYIDPGFEIPGR